LPLLRLAITRTASIGSRVPPALTKTFSPDMSGVANSRSTAATIASGVASRP
jgi:hypothetical protein